MIHARMFLTNPHYRTQFWSDSGMPAEDRPLIAQLCGSDPEILLETAKLIEGGVDGIDLEALTNRNKNTLQTFGAAGGLEVLGGGPTRRS